MHSAAGCTHADSVFTDWSGFWSPVVLRGSSVANVRDTVFRNAQLPVEIVDVSFAGSVHFQNVSFAGVTLKRGSVVSSTSNDYETPFSGYELHYLAEDDEAYDVLVSPLPPEEAGLFGADYIIYDDVMSDCLYLAPGNACMEGAVWPGCPPESVTQRKRLQKRSDGDSSRRAPLTAEYGYAGEYYAEYEQPFGPDGCLSAGEFSANAPSAEDVDHDHGTGTGIPQERYKDYLIDVDDPWMEQTLSVRAHCHRGSCHAPAALFC